MIEAVSCSEMSVNIYETTRQKTEELHVRVNECEVTITDKIMYPRNYGKVRYANDETDGRLNCRLLAKDMNPTT
jgi:hypothetical protein